MSNIAVKRLQVELDRFLSSPIEGITVDSTDIFEWNVTIRGPPGSYYEGGIFEAILKFPYSYPFHPPSFKFMTKIFHPNIYSDGQVCMSFLQHGVDPTEYGSAERWIPAINIRTIFLSVLSLLSEPNALRPVNFKAANMWKNNRELFKQRIVNMIQRKETGGL